ncbi:DMSO reductase, partial [Rhizobiaceae sp. 2RAB30]
GGSMAVPILMTALVLVVIAWCAKLAWWRRLDNLTPSSSPESATGLGFIGRVRLFERPHVNENYLTREMGFRVARKHAAKLRRLALGLGGLAPVILLVLAIAAGGGAAIAFTCIAALSFLAGVLTERWLFFATARHAVMNYYGS